jgi:tetratricopeptide (TPR) repeat protein
MTKLRQVGLIIALLASLVALPPILYGYWRLSAAQSLAEPLAASAEYEAAARLLFWRAELYDQAGRLAADGQNTPRAIQLLEIARRLGALSPSGQLSLGNAYHATGQVEKAIRVWQDSLNNAETRSAASQALFQAYHTRGDFAAQRQVLDKWLAFEPHNATASYQLGLIRMAEAAPEALPLLETAANDPQLAALTNELLPALRTALAEAAPAYRLTVCGRALAAIDEWPLAEQAFVRAVNADATYAPAWAWLGEAFQHTGHGAAAEALQKAVALAPQSVDLRVMLGLYWQRQNDWQPALDEYSAAAKLEPQNPRWLMLQGEAYTHLGNLVTALGYYQKAVALSPSETQTWRALALFCVENDAFIADIGLQAALQAYALEPGSAQNMDILGRALMATGESDSAAAMFKKAMAAAPQEAAPAFHLGLVYLQTGQNELARTTLAAAQALDPDGPIGAQAQKILARYFP